MRAPKRLAMLAATAALAASCGGVGATPYPARPAALLPTGAKAVELPTATPGRPTGAIDTCATALLPPVKLTFDGTSLGFVDQDGIFWHVTWPRGFSARSDQGRAELVTPEGNVLAAEGDVLRNLGGSTSRPDFSVCQVGSVTYGPAS
jgi:hypothetical protein